MFTLRLKLDSRLREDPLGFSDGLFFHNGDDLRFELGLFRDGVVVDDLTQVAVQLKSANATSEDAAWFIEYDESPSAALTAATWKAGAAETATVDVAAIDTSIPSGNYLLTISATTNSSKHETFYAGRVIVSESGYGTSTIDNPGALLYYDATTSDARYVLRSEVEFISVHDRATLDAANASEGAAILIVDTIEVTTDLTISADKKVAVSPSGSFAITTGKLTFHATPVGWGSGQWVFHGNSTSNGYSTLGTGLTLPRGRNSATPGDVEGTFGSVPRRPEWFGAVKGLSTFDNTDSIASAFKASEWTAFAQAGYDDTQKNAYTHVVFGTGIYYHSRTIDILGCQFNATGEGRSGSIIEAFATFDYANSTPDVVDYPQTSWVNVTADAATDTFTSPGHTFSDGEMVWIQTTGTALPAGLTPQTNYWVVGTSHVNGTLQLSATEGGSAINFTSAGTLTAAESHQIRRKMSVYSQLLFGGWGGVNTQGTQAAQLGSFDNHFRFLYFRASSMAEYSTCIFAPHYIQENTEIENCLFGGGTVAQILLGARDRTQPDWFTSNGVRISQCELFSMVRTGKVVIGSNLRSISGRFLDVSNCTCIGRADTASYTAACTVSGAVLTSADHGLSNGDPVYLTTSGAMSGLAANTIYYVVKATADTFCLSTRINDTNYIVTDTGSTGVSWNTSAACLSSIDTSNQITTIRDTHMESGVVGILVSDSLAGAVNTAATGGSGGYNVNFGKLSAWPQTPYGTHLTVQNVDFTNDVEEAALKLNYDSQRASVHVVNLFAQYNIGLGTSAPLLLWDAPRGRSSHGIGTTNKRRIVEYSRGYSSENASPDGVTEGYYVSTAHVDLMEPPVYNDPELFVGQPYVASGGSVNISLGANPALLNSIRDCWGLADLTNEEAGAAGSLTNIGTVIFSEDGSDAPTNTGLYAGGAGAELLQDSKHLYATAGAALNYGDITGANEDYGTSFAFSVWCKIPTLATSGANNTIWSRSGAGVVASTSVAWSTGIKIDATAHPFSNGQIVRVSGTVIAPFLDTTPYVVANKATDNFELTELDGTAVSGTYGAFTAATVELMSGYEMLYSGDNSEMIFTFKHPGAEFEAYYANPLVDPIAGEWTFYYGEYNAQSRAITLHNVTGNSRKTVTAVDGTGTFTGFKPLIDDSVPLYIGTRKSDGASDGLCMVDELTFYNRILTLEEVAWIHNWGSGRSYSEHI